VRAIVGVGLALLVLVPLVALATGGRRGPGAAVEADRLGSAVLRGLLVLAAFVLVVLAVVVVRR
jgi:hypothetical protein